MLPGMGEGFLDELTSIINDGMEKNAIKLPVSFMSPGSPGAGAVRGAGKAVATMGKAPLQAAPLKLTPAMQVKPSASAVAPRPAVSLTGNAPAQGTAPVAMQRSLAAPPQQAAQAARQRGPVRRPGASPSAVPQPVSNKPAPPQQAAPVQVRGTVTPPPSKADVANKKKALAAANKGLNQPAPAPAPQAAPAPAQGAAPKSKKKSKGDNGIMGSGITMGHVGMGLAAGAGGMAVSKGIESMAPPQAPQPY